MSRATERSLYHLIDSELRDSLRWLIRLRWIAATGVLLTTFVLQSVPGLHPAALPLYAIGLLILGYNVLFWYRLRCQRCAPGERRRRTQLLARLQITADWAAMILLIHFSGGIESPIIFYFVFHTVLAAILLRTPEVYLFAGLASLLVTGTTLLEYGGLLPHVPIEGYLPQSLYRAPLYVSARLLFFVSSTFVVAYLTLVTTRRLRTKEEQVIELSTDLQQAYQRQQTLYESARSVTSTLDLQEVLDQLTRSTTTAMGVKACAIQLLDATGTSLDTISLHGLSQADLRVCNVGLDCAPLIDDVLAGEIVTIDDIAHDTRLEQRETILQQGVQATLTVPIPGKEGPLGLMRVYGEQPEAFDEDDEDFLAAVASHGGIAIQNAMAYQAVQALDAAKRKFVLTVTHELRSPVGVVRSLLRTLVGGYAGELDEVQEDLLGRALRRADFLQTLIDDLLDLAASKTGLRQEAEPEPVDLRAILRRVVGRFLPAAEEKALQVDVEVAAEPSLFVVGTADDLDRALTNLISNAIKYTPPGGSVAVALGAVGDAVELSVSDSGIGIPEEAQAQLFEEFYRAPNAKATVQQGTGLGLVITREIITRYGGRIEVESREGEGTTFRVELPLTEPPRDRSSSQNSMP